LNGVRLANGTSGSRDAISGLSSTKYILAKLFSLSDMRICLLSQSIRRPPARWGKWEAHEARLALLFDRRFMLNLGNINPIVVMYHIPVMPLVTASNAGLSFFTSSGANKLLVAVVIVDVIDVCSTGRISMA
jgi:hypothetical protein